MCSVGIRFAAALLLAASAASAEVPEEFRIAREPVFVFTAKPRVTRQGDNITIAFASRGYCDTTVAIEDRGGRIVRHLACGVLGDNAPPPFRKKSLSQSIAWDGKDDTGKYLDNKDALTVRVSLGLKPRFERSLYWSPHKRISNIAPCLAAAPEGVYVFEGLGLDHLRLFDHDGNYVRTIYPFPADKVVDVIGLQTHTYVQDEATLPLKLGYEQATLLTSGSSAWGGGGHAGGFGATAIAVHSSDKPGQPSRIALAFHRVNRLASDGSSGGLPIQGPKVSFVVQGHRRREQVVGPTSIAFSPDGRFLYLTGFVWKTGAHHGNANCFHMVTRMEYAKQEEPTVFVGARKTDDGFGDKNDQFCVPTSVACDARGRVYVADYLNNRIQVFAPDAKFLKTLRVPHPATVRVDPRSGEIWAFSWPMIGPSSRAMRDRGFDPRRLPATVTGLGTFEKPAPAKPVSLPAVSASGSGGWIATGGQTYKVAVDWYAKERTLWVVGRKATVSLAEANWMGGAGQWAHLGGWDKRGIRLFRFKDEKWVKVLDFAEVARKKVKRLMPPSFSRQRLYVNPADENLYVCEEQTGAGKSFYSVLRVDPETGTIREIKLPFDAEDIVFGIDGLAYLRTDREVVRYDPRTWREVPWDYGEQRASVGFISSRGGARDKVTGALAIPGRRPVWWHSSGMWISPRGHLAVANNIAAKPKGPSAKDKYFHDGISQAYTPEMYPGRSGSRVIVVFDRHGKIVYDDAVPGLTNADGIGIDNEDSLYIMVAAPRVLDGKRYFNEKSETLAKFRPKKGRFVSSGRSRLPLPDNLKPDRSADITKYGMGATWAENPEWLYGGVGYGGQGGSCTCWHSRFQLDYFGRSFAPEVRRFKVAVLDSAGNVILRVGKYGNVDDGKPLVPDPAIGNRQPDRSAAGGSPIGDDEVALVHPAYVGTHTDRRLFISDPGNGRIVSVRLDYHATETVALRHVPDEGR